MKIETEIKNIIEEVTCSKYIGKLRVVYEEDIDLWSLLLYLDLEQTPLVMAYQGDVEKFKEFIRKEMKSRKLQFVEFWNTIRQIPDEEEDEMDDNYE